MGFRRCDPRVAAPTVGAATSERFRQRTGRRRGALPLALAALCVLSSPARASEPEPSTLLASFERETLHFERARRVEGERLAVGPAILELQDGMLTPAGSAEGGGLVEAVFTGSGELVMRVDDPVERAQLAFFTGAEVLRVPVTQAVLVATAERLAVGRALDAARSGPAGAAGQWRETAEKVFRQWRQSPERRHLGIDEVRLRLALGESGLAAFTTGWFPGGSLGDFFCRLEPGLAEPLTLGQFVRRSRNEADRRLMETMLLRLQSRGRKLGVGVDDLGRWDTWVSLALPDSAPPGRGAERWKVERYELSVRLEPQSLHLTGTARLTLRDGPPGGRTVRLAAHPDLAIRSVRSDGRELFFRHEGERLFAVLPKPPVPGETVEIEIEYGGNFIYQPAFGNPRLRDPTDWYPQGEGPGLATYDVTLRWPRKLQLLAAGRRVDGGEDGAWRWERRQLTTPARAFSFELGSFRILEEEVKGLHVTLALGPAAFWKIRQRRGLLEVIARSLAYFRDIFGEFPGRELVVVTTPRSFSQAMPGFITLSTEMAADGGGGPFGPRAAVRQQLVVGHEVAHQWWGHLVGWSSYRDRWISEAMANYAALLFSRHEGGLGTPLQWLSSLSRRTEDGWPLESVGPLVLGERLASSRTQAYQAVVYTKGAIVLSTLAHRVGGDVFLATLRDLLHTQPRRELSTRRLIDALEARSGIDLERFTRQFIYGTGLPDVFYDYRVELQPDGEWVVRGVAVQEPSYRLRYGLRRLSDGALDLDRQRIDLMDVESSQLVVPVRTTVGTAAESGSTSERLLVLDGRRSEFELHLEDPPDGVWLDRDGEVFGRFLNQRRYPKGAFYQLGKARADRGEAAEAERLLRAALEAPVVALPEPFARRHAGAQVEAEGRFLDRRIRLRLAELYLDQGRIEEAQELVAEARRHVGGENGEALREGVMLVEARLALRRGDERRTWKLLRRAVAQRRLDDPRGWLLLAVAAERMGRPEEALAAGLEARMRGADVKLLATGAAGAGS